MNTLELGQTAMIMFEGRSEGDTFEKATAFEGGTSDRPYPLVIGSGSFIPGFEEQLIGMKIGESKIIEVSFPENYQEKSLAGQPVFFKVDLASIR